MTRIQCPQESCIHWEDGLCGSSEIELEAHTLICLTFEEPVDAVNAVPGAHVNDALDDDIDIDWDDDESLIEDELDERLYENKALDLRNNLDDDDEYEDDNFDDFDEMDDDGLDEDELFHLARESNNW